MGNPSIVMRVGSVGKISLISGAIRGSALTVMAPPKAVFTATVGSVTSSMQAAQGPPLAFYAMEGTTARFEVKAPSQILFAGQVGPSGGGTGGGTAWLNGAAVPNDATGNDGDYYVRDVLLHVYRKTSGVWGTPIGQWFPYN